MSRLLCPRRLLPLTTYRACVVPAFEAGRLAGLGRDPGTDGAAPAWTAASARGLELPVYFTWTFRTGRGGDFESLVRRLQARRARPAASAPGRCTSVPRPTRCPRSRRRFRSTARSATCRRRLPQLPDLAPFGTRLGKVLDTAADLANGNPADARIVAPPLYGMWHAAQFRVRAPDTPWLSSLNLDPRRRTTAGLGARVIRENQEQLMAEAWRQVGDVERANEALRRAQLGRSASAAVWQRSVSALGTDTLFALTGPVQGRVRRGTGVDHARRRRARLPAAQRHRRPCVPADRQSPRGCLGRRVGLAAAPQLLTRLDQGVIAAAGPPPERPSGMQDADDVPGSGGGGGGGVITGGGGVITGGGGIFTGRGRRWSSPVAASSPVAGAGAAACHRRGRRLHRWWCPVWRRACSRAAHRRCCRRRRSRRRGPRTTTFLTPDRINQLPDRLDFRPTLPGSDVPVERRHGGARCRGGGVQGRGRATAGAARDAGGAHRRRAARGRGRRPRRPARRARPRDDDPATRAGDDQLHPAGATADVATHRRPDRTDHGGARVPARDVRAAPRPLDRAPASRPRARAARDARTGAHEPGGHRGVPRRG